jgi:hypothetical protein
MSDLTDKELNAILTKIRDEYNFYAKENPKMFKLLPFEERYTDVLKSRGSLQKFFHAEIEFLEKLKRLHDENKKKIEMMKNSTMDRILEEQEAGMKHYPKIDFHPNARNDLKYFYGALIEFVENELVILNRIFKGTPEIRTLQEQFIIIERVGAKYRNMPSIRITEHINTINAFRGNMSKIEQDTQIIIRDTCHAFKQLAGHLDDILLKKRVTDSIPLPIDEKDPARLKALYEGLNNSIAVNKIIDRCNAIIADFRMEGILSWKKP